MFLQSHKKRSDEKLDLCFTVDLEDHRQIKNFETARYERNTELILCWLSNKKIKATFFVVGNLARKSPHLIKQVTKMGHDIGFHSENHIPLTLEKPERFLRQTEYGKKKLEDLIGESVIGFRAPCFSLTRSSSWAIDVLSSLDFEYSSSVIPCRGGKFSFPGVPLEPFLWHSGLVEFPMVLSNFFGKSFPSIGGLYLRFIPLTISIKTLGRYGVPWTHIHPQDIDHSEPFTRVENLSYIESFIYGLNRKPTFKKLEYLVKKFNVTNLESMFHSIDYEKLRKFEE